MGFARSVVLLVLAGSAVRASTIDLNAPHVPGELLARAWSWETPETIAETLLENNAVETSYNPPLDFMTLSIDEDDRGAVIDGLDRSGVFQFVELNYYAGFGDGQVPEPGTWMLVVAGLALIQLVNRKAG